MRLRMLRACLGFSVFVLCWSTVLTGEQGGGSISASAPRALALRPVEDAAVFDTSPFDGHPDFFSHDGLNSVILNPGVIETRAVVRFDLRAVRGRGRSIRRATFQIVLVGRAFTPGIPLPVEVRAFTSDDPLDLVDFHDGHFLGVFDAISADVNTAVSFDVTAFLPRNLRKEPFIGFTLRTNVPAQAAFGSLEFEPAPTLGIAFRREDRSSEGEVNEPE